MDYCTPSFANRHFAPSYHPSNVALNKSALTSSEELNLAWPRHAGNALDGDLCTKWSSASGAHEWLVIDLGAPHELHNRNVCELKVQTYPREFAYPRNALVYIYIC